MVPLRMSTRPFLQPFAECLFRCILAALEFHFRLQLVGNNLADVSVNVFTIGSGMLSQRVDVFGRKLQVNVECRLLASILLRPQSEVIVFSQATWRRNSPTGLGENQDRASCIDAVIQQWVNRWAESTPENWP